MVKKKLFKKFIVGVAAMTMVVGGVVSANAATYYSTDALASTTSEKQGWTFEGSWSRQIELIPIYEREKWPVVITCGYEKYLWVNNDYITGVGGTAEGYVSCGYVGNSNGTKYSAWIQEGKVSTSKVKIAHKSTPVVYGVKIHFGE